MQAVETFEHAGLTINIYPDDTGSESPRDWDNMGTCWFSRRGYRNGMGDADADSPFDFGLNDCESWDDVAERIGRQYPGSIVLPVFIYEHSGITIWADGPDHSPFDYGGWDSGQLGVIYALPEAIRRNWNRKRITAKVRAQAAELLRAEIKVLDQYLTGDVYGYVIEDSDGNHLDSCWGFYGLDDVTQEAKSIAESIAADQLAERNERLAEHESLETLTAGFWQSAA